jgi:hypothetical protein
MSGILELTFGILMLGIIEMQKKCYIGAEAFAVVCSKLSLQAFLSLRRLVLPTMSSFHAFSAPRDSIVDARLHSEAPTSIDPSDMVEI